MGKKLEGVDAPLRAGAEDRREDRLGAGAEPRAVAAPHFAVDHRRANGLLAQVIGGVHARVTQVGEDLFEVLVKEVRQATIAVVGQSSPDQPAKFCAKPACGDPQPVRRQFALLVAVARGQAPLQKLLDRPRKPHRTTPKRIFSTFKRGVIRLRPLVGLACSMTTMNRGNALRYSASTARDSVR